MELPTYVIPESLLSRQPAPLAPRSDRSLRRSFSELEDLALHSRTADKRQCPSAESASLKSGTGCIELRQHTIPESLQSPLLHVDRALQAPTARNDGFARHHNIPTTIPHSGLSRGIPSPSQTGGLALNTHREVQKYSPFSTPLSARQSEELFPTGPAARRSPDEGPDFTLPFQTTTTAKDFDMKYDCFLEMPDKRFFPTPSMTDPQEEAPTSILMWNAATKQPELLDDAGEYVLDPAASTEARLSPVLKAVAAAGFESLDSALVAYYAKSVKEDDRLGQEQRLNRIRRLPVLLKELHLASEGWGQWQRRSFQEQVIKSTEDILIAELENHLAARSANAHQLAGAGGPSRQAFRYKAQDETDIEAELPNTWTLLTSLSTKYDTIAARHGPSDMPNLVSRFLAASADLDTSGARGGGSEPTSHGNTNH
ncbi:hypothetical protein N7468_006146 [Penicillium chermesinum]|uniref:Uncharacterized protein n=1 Tax=Penicillium chermesinum TaxID=63820 RepID=A0A9W9P165_9EURO|nr:uncharacterized protein N7468_006146 [Penicillium chermesinum]KAJ5233190.1 hypothetical protein N7468_006146 [Penicillium chermesinum]KAJ6172824.1 hypothetical protein N7470_001891 [Penicillium chermesinum]